MNRIAIIIPYFGQLPFWASVFFKSCALNGTVDFYIYTDQAPPRMEARNIHVVHLSFDEYCSAVSKRLNIDFHPNSSYKLCDLKPFLGAVHEDMLTDNQYDFWGFGDMDLVWGRLRHFYTDDLLAAHDVFSTHADRVSGHLALVRNTEHWRRRCFGIPLWREKLTDPAHRAIDEIDFSLLIYGQRLRLYWKLHNKVLMRLPGIDEWKWHCRLMLAANRLSCPRHLYFVEQYTTPWQSDIETGRVDYTWRDGLLTRCDGMELPYLHFMCLKRVWIPTPLATTDAGAIRITSNGFQCI